MSTNITASSTFFRANQSVNTFSIHLNPLLTQFWTYPTSFNRAWFSWYLQDIPDKIKWVSLLVSFNVTILCFVRKALVYLSAISFMSNPSAVRFMTKQLIFKSSFSTTLYDLKNKYSEDQISEQVLFNKTCSDGQKFFLSVNGLSMI